MHISELKFLSDKVLRNDKTIKMVLDDFFKKGNVRKLIIMRIDGFYKDVFGQKLQKINSLHFIHWLTKTAFRHRKHKQPAWK